MKRKSLWVVVLSVLVFCVSTIVSAQTVEERMEALEKRVEQLETLLEKEGVELPGEVSHEQGLTNIGDRITLSGALEVEGAYVAEKQLDGSKNRNSDIVLATLELGLEAVINDQTTGNIVLLWEEDDTEPIGIDEGTITWAGNRFDITAGRFYMPFGTFNSHFISDPLTLEIGETRESGIQVTFSPSDRVQASLAVANGDVDKTSSGDNVNDFGMRLDFHPLIDDNTTLIFGLQYYSDIADTDGEILGGTGNILNKKAGGIGVNMDWAYDSWNASAEYIGALNNFDSGDLDTDTDGTGDKPITWNFEVARSFHDVYELALRYEGSKEFADFPEAQYGISGSWDVEDNMTLSAEYLYGIFDRGFSTAGTRRRHAMTTQLAIGF